MYRSVWVRMKGLEKVCWYDYKTEKEIRRKYAM